MVRYWRWCDGMTVLSHSTQRSFLRHAELRQTSFLNFYSICQQTLLFSKLLNFLKNLSLQILSQMGQSSSSKEKGKEGERKMLSEKFSKRALHLECTCIAFTMLSKSSCMILKPFRHPLTWMAAKTKKSTQSVEKPLNKNKGQKIGRFTHFAVICSVQRSSFDVAL